MRIYEKFLKLSYDLHMENKTGRECEWCGGTETQENSRGVFCKGCGAPSRKIYGYCMGVPIYDRKDYYEAMKESVV